MILMVRFSRYELRFLTFTMGHNSHLLLPDSSKSMKSKTALRKSSLVNRPSSLIFMPFMWKLKKSSWILFFGVMAFSCLDKPDCFRLYNDQIGVSLKVLGTNKADVVTLTGVEIEGVGNILSANASASSFLIPLNYLTDQTGVAIASDKINGTILLKYLSQAQFVSDECGPRYILSGLEVNQQTGFDSVRVLTGEVGNPPVINLEIFRCPTTNLVKMDFYQLYVTGTGKKTSQPLSLSIDHVQALYSGEISNAGSVTSTITVPVNLVVGSSDFKITHGGQPDTVSLTYTLTQEERYNVCPAKMYVSGLEVTSPDFDSVSIAVVDKKKVDAPQDPATTNVLIFKCPQTNLMRVSFKTPKGESFVSASTTFNKITTNFSADKFYEDKTASSVELPINAGALTAEYYFDIKVNDGEPAQLDTLRVSYDAFNKTIFNACGVQKVYDNLNVTFTDFTLASPAVPKDSIQFPSVTNIEIIKN